MLSQKLCHVNASHVKNKYFFVLVSADISIDADVTCEMRSHVNEGNHLDALVTCSANAVSSHQAWWSQWDECDCLRMDKSSQCVATQSPHPSLGRHSECK